MSVENEILMSISNQIHAEIERCAGKIIAVEHAPQCATFEKDDSTVIRFSGRIFEIPFDVYDGNPSDLNAFLKHLPAAEGYWIYDLRPLKLEASK